MRMFSCPACGATGFFSNMTCICGAELMFDPVQNSFKVNVPACSNRTEIRCNWAAESDGAEFCRSCAMTKVIPDAFRGDNRMLWASFESSKRWVLATLARWGWFTAEDAGQSPEFHLLLENTASGLAIVVRGHANGLVTIDLAETDPVEEVHRREVLSERLRTMTVHFCHEIAHFLFERLTASRPEFPVVFRAIFGDERENYGEALMRHNANGPPAG